MFVSTCAKGQGAVNAKQVTTAAAILLESVTVDRKNITIQNLGPNPIYIGFASTVTAATGFQVAGSGGTYSVDLANGTKIYAIAATADQVSPSDTRVVEYR